MHFRRSSFYFLILILCVLPAAAQSNVGSDTQARADAITNALAKRLDSLDKDLQKDLQGKDLKNPKTVTVRDLSNGALVALQQGREGSYAESLLQRIYELQDMDSKSPKFGALPWSAFGPPINDDNSIEFGTESWGPILLGYRDRLSPKFVRDSKPHVQAGLAALARHNVPVSYTNIFLMNTVNTLLMAQAIEDNDALQRGQQQLEQWIAYTQKAGIHEFDSPTYYGTDLDSLVIGYRYGGTRQLRDTCKKILDYFWQDIAANYFPANGRLAGPHSRDYDFLRGDGGLLVFAFAEGLMPMKSFSDLDLEKAYLAENLRAGGYHPAPAILATANVGVREIRQRWDEQPWRDRYLYATTDYSMGSSNGEYGPQDKMFNAELGSNLPDITIVPDTLDAPYGKLKHEDKNGHNKPVHIPLHLASAQNKEAALLLLDLDPSHEKNFDSLTTNLLLPAAADEIRLDNDQISAGGPFSKKAKIDSVAGVRAGNACFAARLFQADAFQDASSQIVLKADNDSLANGVLRLAIYHTQQTTASNRQKHLHVGFLAVVSSCGGADGLKQTMETLRHAEVKQSASSTVWRVAARVNGATLQTARDSDCKCTAEELVDGKQVTSPPLEVNGKMVSLLQ